MTAELPHSVTIRRKWPTNGEAMIAVFREAAWLEGTLQSWARHNAPSLIEVKVKVVAFAPVATAIFGNLEDAALFKLRWSQ